MTIRFGEIPEESRNVNYSLASFLKVSSMQAGFGKGFFFINEILKAKRKIIHPFKIPLGLYKDVGGIHQLTGSSQV